MNVKLFFLSLGLVLFGATLAFYVNGFPVNGIDDANIYMVYMRNFAKGLGFVYNIGGERVEGFTSLFWTILGSGFYKFADSIGVFLIGINLLVISYTLYRYLRYFEKAYSNDSNILLAIQLLLVGLLLAIPGFFSWTIISLLETGIWCSVLSLLLLSLLEGPDKPGLSTDLSFYIMLVLLILIRPESILWGLFFVFARGFKVYYFSQDIAASAKAILPGFLVYIVCIGLLVSWRIAYFGYPLPNTFYAKVSGDKLNNLLYGSFYLYKNFLHNPLLLLLLLMVLFNLKKILSSYNYLVLSGFFVLTLFIPLYTGGDHFGMGRFIQPSLFGIYLLLSMLIFEFKGLGWKKVLAFLFFVSFISQNTWYESLLYRTGPIKHEFTLAESGRKKSEQLNQFFSYEDDGYPEIGVLTAGGAAYSYLGETNDLLGLNNKEMAHFESAELNSTGPKNHSGFKEEVFFQQEPDIFFLALEILENDDPRLNDPLVIGEFSKEVFRSIEDNPLFEVEFDAVLISNIHLNYSIKTFASEDFLKTLDPEDYTYKKIVYQ